MQSYVYLKTIFDNKSIQQLAFVQLAMTVESMADLARSGDLSSILKKISTVVQIDVKQLNQDITPPLLDMWLKLKAIENNLREYNESIKIDSQFYL